MLLADQASYESPVFECPLYVKLSNLTARGYLEIDTAMSVNYLFCKPSIIEHIESTTTNRSVQVLS